MRIKQRVNNIIKKYRTRNPYEIADYLNIEVIFTPIKRINGFCDQVARKKFIVINSNLPYHVQKQTCAHELAHILLHKGCSYHFMIEHTYYALGKYERQANEFAWQLFFDETDCIDNYEGNVNYYASSNEILELLNSPRT